MNGLLESSFRCLEKKHFRTGDTWFGRVVHVGHSANRFTSDAKRYILQNQCERKGGGNNGYSLKWGESPFSARRLGMALRIWCSTKHCKLRSWERLLLLLLITLEFLVEGAIDIHKDHNVRRNDSRNATTQSLKSDAQTRRC